MAFSLLTMNFAVNGLKARCRWDKKMFLHLITFNGFMGRVWCIYLWVASVGFWVESEKKFL